MTILFLFHNLKNNYAKNIAKLLGVPVETVNKEIDEFLKKGKKYTGEKCTLLESSINVK